MQIAIQEILRQLHPKLSASSESAYLDAQVLVAHHLGKTRSWVLAHPEALLSEDQQAEIYRSVNRLVGGEPLPYIVGHWEFFGMDFIVTPDVLIPRPETELLVERAISWLMLHPKKRRIVDIGTGSGCIGIAIAKHILDADILLTDLSAEALLVAKQNAEKHCLHTRVEIRRSDMMDQVPEYFDLICANLPYIPTQALNSLPVAKREPYAALDGGKSGLTHIQRLLEESKGRLVAGGMLLLEIDASESGELRKFVDKEFPQSKLEIFQDLSGEDRCVAIERPYRVVHLCTPQEWQSPEKLVDFRDLSLTQQGFIHCSQPEQIIDVANRYYQGSPEMVILWINPDNLDAEIRWEWAGDSYYPHIYGPINLNAIEAATPLRLGHDGVFRYIFC